MTGNDIALFSRMQVAFFPLQYFQHLCNTLLQTIQSLLSSLLISHCQLVISAWMQTSYDLASYNVTNSHLVKRDSGIAHLDSRWGSEARTGCI